LIIITQDERIVKGIDKDFYIKSGAPICEM